MIHFESDYLYGASPEVLQLLVETNMEATKGYGEDCYCTQAANLIQMACASPHADVHFLMGGTQTNATAVAAMLKPYQGVLCADSAHIAVHETGAVEATGHKVLTLTTTNGKITAHQVKQAYQEHYDDASHEHMVQPGMVYISQPTETGLIYSFQELSSLSETCKALQLPLYIDGARLGYALEAETNNVTLADIASFADMFYIGGTKMGTLFGEALVIPNVHFQKDFRYLMKREGAMLAKGRLLGLQFISLFQDGLYYRLGKHGVEMARRLKMGLQQRNIPMLYETFTNQLFLTLPLTVVHQLKEEIGFEVWQNISHTHQTIRICTSWATRETDVDGFLKCIDILKL